MGPDPNMTSKVRTVFVCALNRSAISNGVIPQGYCAKHSTNKINPLTGK